MKRKKWNIVYSIFKKYIRYNVIFLTLSILAIGTAYAAPIINASIIDKGIEQKDMKVLFLCLILFFLINMVSSIISFFITRVRLKYQYVIEKDLKNKVISYFLYGNHTSETEGELDTLIRSDIGNFISFVSDNVIAIGLAVVKILISVVLLLHIQLMLGCIAIGIQVLMIMVNHGINKRMEANSITVRDAYIQVIQKVNEIIRNVKELRMLKGADYMMKQYNKALLESYYSMQKSNGLVQMTIFTSTMLEIVSECFVLGLGGVLIMQGKLSLGLIISFMNYCTMFSTPVNEIISVWTEYCNEKESIDAVFDIFLDLEKSNKGNEVQEDISEIASIEIKNVSFSYEEERKILENVNVVFTNEKINYIIGKSGIGKTTFTKLLMGYLRADSGSIRFGGKEIGDLLEENQMHQYISWVPQEPILFLDTIRNNILLGNPVSESRLQEVCRKCLLYEDIMQLPAGFDTMLGDDGEKLSVGQKHRLGLVRALLQEHPIMIIDEGTAGLDSLTEQCIKANIRELCNGRLTIIITHSTSFILEDAKVYEIVNRQLKERERHNV